ncbi:MAG: F0F1 ATP synthase subunit alpha [Patescibacteria group bacterium]|mgnify:CR=1 FL=1
MKFKSTGRIQKLFDGVAFCNGLSEAFFNEVVRIKNTSTGRDYKGLVMSLREDEVGVMILGNYRNLKTGDLVETTGKHLSVIVSDNILGKTIDPLGEPLFSYEHFKSEGEEMALEQQAPSVIQRKNIFRPLSTGVLAIDALVPVGKGQRQLVIGDRKTGKSAFCLSAILNQKDKNVICVYVSIGQKASKVAQFIETLKISGAISYTCVVAGTSSDPASINYLAPYTGTAIAEYFAHKGRDVLVVYDDLTKHAESYREVSLLLGRPAGREAFPGDVFYLHSRLLERSAQLSDEFGGGSITSLPIIETQAGDVASFVPTNVISITDGQIFLDSQLFNLGQKPALNVGLSVSRVGGAAQTPIMKKIAGSLKLDLALFRELEAFSQFGSDLDLETKNKLIRGFKMMQLLKQDLTTLYETPEQIMFVFAAIRGYLDLVEDKDIETWKHKFLEHLKTHCRALTETLRKETKLKEDTEKVMVKEIENFMITFTKLYAKHKNS